LNLIELSTPGHLDEDDVSQLITKLDTETSAQMLLYRGPKRIQEDFLALIAMLKNTNNCSAVHEQMMPTE